jgi:hypothetical protein
VTTGQQGAAGDALAQAISQARASGNLNSLAQALSSAAATGGSATANALSQALAQAGAGTAAATSLAQAAASGSGNAASQALAQALACECCYCRGSACYLELHLWHAVGWSKGIQHAHTHAPLSSYVPSHLFPCKPHTQRRELVAKPPHLDALNTGRGGTAS